MNDHPSLTLATFAAQLDFDSIPHAVVERTVNLYVDWLGFRVGRQGCAAGRNDRALRAPSRRRGAATARAKC